MHLRSLLFFALSALAWQAHASMDLKTRLLAGEVQFLAHQQKYFDALQRIDAVQAISPEALRRALRHNTGGNPAGGEAALSLADIELGYRMSQRAGAAIRAVLNEDSALPERNRAAYELAKIYYNKRQYELAQYALQLIRGEVFYPFNHDIDYLQAKIHVRRGQFDAAINILERLQYDERFHGFAAFNLAHTLMAAGRDDEGRAKLAEVGDMEVYDEALLSLRDKANLVLGYRALSDGVPEQALQRLGKVRQHGAFSTRALLGIAWAHMALQQYRSALAPWGELQRRDADDATVQEAWLALPYTYGKLGVHSKAVTLYEEAIAQFEHSRAAMRAALQGIGDGSFFEQLVELGGNVSEQGLATLYRLDSMRYLGDVLAQPAFQTAVKDLIEVDQLRATLAGWQRSVAALQALTERREQSVRQLRPQLSAQLEDIDSALQALVQQHDALDDALTAITPQTNTRWLADASQQTLLASLHSVAVASETLPAVQRDSLQQRARRLQGIVDWQLVQHYPQRMQSLSSQRQQLGESLRQLQTQRDRVARQHQHADNVGVYRLPLFELARQMQVLEARLLPLRDTLQQRVANTLREALQRRSKLLDEYLAVARYELAKNYDLMAQQERAQ